MIILRTLLLINKFKANLKVISHSSILQAYSTYSYFEGKALTPDVTFAALSVFNQMIVPLIVLPTMFTFHVNAVISTRRLGSYFDAPEIEETDDGRPKSASIAETEVTQDDLNQDDNNVSFF